MKKQPITISVTEEHLRDGKRASPHSCPIALALGAALNLTPRCHVSVGAYKAYIVDLEDDDDIFGHPIGLPTNAIVQMRLIDLGRKVEPFSFEITPPRLTP